jgi:tRNA(fMet)-specific endonuclease VapC
MRYLLDTNVWIEVLKGMNIRLIDKYADTPASELVSCSPVRAELMHGAEKYRDAEARVRDINKVLRGIVSLPFDDRCADRYGELRNDLEARKCVIGPMDLQIAAIALVHDLTLISGNVEEFRRVHGLRVENWCD